MSWFGLAAPARRDSPARVADGGVLEPCFACVQTPEPLPGAAASVVER
jgi:hypothetical protein